MHGYLLTVKDASYPAADQIDHRHIPPRTRPDRKILTLRRESEAVATCRKAPDDLSRGRFQHSHLPTVLSLPVQGQQPAIV